MQGNLEHDLFNGIIQGLDVPDCVNWSVNSASFFTEGGRGEGKGVRRATYALN